MICMQMIIHTLFIFIYILSIQSAECTESPVVQTAQGLLRGSFLTTYDGKNIYSFRGVRFVEPATGANRFKPPVPLKPWSGIHDATEDGPVCLQPAVDAYGPASEDCLFLNVYTKKLTGKQPVIVFFHPGGYFSLTGRSNWFGPEYMLSRDIVLVTTNYRLGPLGFLCTEARLLRGNYGMKDQVAVLQWVKQNIAHFGGDPDSVTIVGYSAGSASVILHMLSPMSRGLFHRAIAMSGSATSAWAINHHPMDLAKQLTSQMCAETTTSQQIYECVKPADGQFMANITYRMRLWSGPRIALFGPVVEKDYGDGEERFLTDEPIDLIQRGEFAHVPLILGVTRDEFSYQSYAVVQNNVLLEEFNQQPDNVMPRAFMYERDSNQSQQVTRTLRKFYLNNLPISNTTRSDLGMIFRDALITFPQVQAAKLLAQTSTKPVYLYMFTYPGRFSFKYIPETSIPAVFGDMTAVLSWPAHQSRGVTSLSGLMVLGSRRRSPVRSCRYGHHHQTKGVVHHDDLMYLFHISALLPKFNKTDPEYTMVDKLTSVWTSFARSGLPMLPQPNVSWIPLTRETPNYLEINHDFKMVPGVPFPRFMELWESLFPVSGPHQIYY